MLQLSREEHCALAGLNIEAFQTLVRYRRVPVLPAEFTSGRGYWPIETMALAICNEIVEQHGVFREKAAGICSGAAADMLVGRWDELRETLAARQLAGKDELHFGRVQYPGTAPQGGGFKPVLGTMEQIAAQHTAKAITSMTISVTRVAALVSHRAAEHRIDSEIFWAKPFPAPAAKTRPPKKGTSK